MANIKSMRFQNSIIGLFLLGRFLLLMSLPLEGLRGYGDFEHFYNLASMGIPFIDIWVEFPPVFPLFSRLLFELTDGSQHVYDYLLVIVWTIVQAGCLWAFIRLLRIIYPENPSPEPIWLYFTISLILPYSWWYFDSLAVLATLLGILWVFEGRTNLAGMSLALGTLTKLFPILALPMAWRWLELRKASTILLVVLGITFSVYAGLYLGSSEQTLASIRSQGAKGSWETVWALIDGNYKTGNFGPEIERYDPSKAEILRGNPAKISPWLALIPFAAIGGWFFWRARINSIRAAISFLGVTWCIFLIWTPGYSPQWVLYLLPIVLLVLPLRKATLFAIVLTVVNLLEWPVMLSRGYNWGLWLTILLRTLLFMVLLLEFLKPVYNPYQAAEAS